MALSHRIEMTSVGDQACRFVQVAKVADWAEQKIGVAAIAPAALMEHYNTAAE